MRNIHIDYQGEALNFMSASLIAKEVAEANKMQDPTIISWHQSGMPEIPPYYDGADPDTWWAKYGAGNGGQLEICLGDDFQFIMMDTRGYEQLGEMPLRNLSDAEGNQYLCHAPLGKHLDRPTPEACAQLDGWAADQL